MKKDPKLYVIHILECIQKIEEYTNNNEESFFNSSLIRDAVLRNLQTMAEATQNLDEKCYKNYPNIEWKKISGFRNILVHDYLGNIDGKRIWYVIEKDLPELKQAMIKEFPEWKNEQ